MALDLFPYQKAGAKWLAGKARALLADDMGLGKSAQAIRAAEAIGAKRILVVCPAVARINWEREFQKFSDSPPPFDVLLSSSTPRRPGHSLILSYDMAVKLAPEIKDSFDLLILDEVQFLKSPTAARTKAIFGRNGLVRKAARTWCLSGTPAPNHAAELWVLFFTFGITKLSYDEFVSRYCHSYLVDGRGRRQITGTRVELIPELRSMLEPIILRRKKEDVLKELPPVSFGTITVEASPVDIAIDSSFFKYVFPRDRSQEFFNKVKAEYDMANAVASTWGEGYSVAKALEATAGSVSTLRKYTALQKLPAVAELLKTELELGVYDKIVVFAIHQTVIEGLRSRLREFSPITLYGRTPPEKRQRYIDDFQKSPKVRVFIGNIQACSTSITLTAAHQVLMLEQSWTPADNAQAIMRCHRIGQKKPVTVRVATLPDSLDQRVADVLIKKSRELVKLFDKERASGISPGFGDRAT